MATGCAERRQHRSPLVSRGCKGNANALSDVLALPLPPLAILALLLWPCAERQWGGSEAEALCREAVPVGVQRAQRRRQRIIRCAGSAFAPSGHPSVIVVGVAAVDPRWWHHAERQFLLASRGRKGDANASSDALAMPLTPLAIPLSLSWVLR
jgi:hypothetical protein